MAVLPMPSLVTELHPGGGGTAAHVGVCPRTKPEVSAKTTPRLPAATRRSPIGRRRAPLFGWSKCTRLYAFIAAVSYTADIFKVRAPAPQSALRMSSIE